MSVLKRLQFVFRVLVIMVLVLRTQVVYAQAPVIIRDAEIEDTLAQWIAPLLEASDLGTGSVNLILVKSPQVNAFVAGGANIFIYTGLIEKSENPGEVIGVLAHELGHIAGGHLVSTRDAFERASYESILGMVLGIGAAIVTGQGAAANAIIAGTGTVAQRRFLSHSRVNESSADQFALRAMQTAGMSPEGLQSFLQKLESEELLPASQQSEYVRTHPLTANRINALNTQIAESPHRGETFPEIWSENHLRMKAKLTGFIDPGRVPWVYGDRDESVAARYARAIAAYREKRVDDALTLINGLIAQELDNPYFHELKGQMLVEFGRVAESLPAYQKAVGFAPEAGLIRIAYAHALIETSTNPEQLKDAVDHLRRALQDEPRSARVHRLLATAYGRLGREAEAKLHLAEEAVLLRKLPYARRQAERALERAKGDGGDEHTVLKIKDLLVHIKNLEQKSDE